MAAKRSKGACVVSMTGDPVTVGHRDIIGRASRIFGFVYVLVSRESSKPGRIFGYEDKVRTITADLKADGVRNFRCSRSKEPSSTRPGCSASGR